MYYMFVNTGKNEPAKNIMKISMKTKLYLWNTFYQSEKNKIEDRKKSPIDAKSKIINIVMKINRTKCQSNLNR